MRKSRIIKLLGSWQVWSVRSSLKSMKLFLFFSSIFLFVSGCASRPLSSPPPHVPASDCQRQTQTDIFKKNGVQIIQVGDELRLILASHRVFVKNTATLQMAAYPVLNEIVTLLNQRKSLCINVLAYTPSLDDFTPNVSLAQQQAQSIVDYFLHQGLNTRLIVAKAWKGVSNRRKQGTGSFSDDPPSIFSVEIRTRLLHPEDAQ